MFFTVSLHLCVTYYITARYDGVGKISLAAGLLRWLIGNWSERLTGYAAAAGADDRSDALHLGRFINVWLDAVPARLALVGARI